MGWNNMKILFFGTPHFAEIVFQKLLNSKHKIVGLVARADKPAGRGKKVISPNIVHIAKSNGIQIFQPEKLKEVLDDFREIDCDIFVTASYGKILPKELLDLHLCVNVHPSLLPKYRGATPIQSALLNGDEVTGVSIMKTEIGMDDGDIFMQKQVKILPEDDYISLEEKLAKISSEMLLETLEKIENGTAKRQKQDESHATFVKMIKKEDGLLDFSMKTQTLVNKVRAYCADPVAYFFLGEERIKVYKSTAFENDIDYPQKNVGEILCTKKRFLIQAKDGIFEILKCQAPGGKVLDACSFLNGYRFKTMVVNA